jgi:hypothetical protein
MPNPFGPNTAEHGKKYLPRTSFLELVHMQLAVDRGMEVDCCRELRETVGARSGDVSYLLEGWGSRKDVRTGQLLDGPKEKWKSDIEVVKATIRFLEKTGRLTYQPEAD